VLLLCMVLDTALTLLRLLSLQGDPDTCGTLD